MVFSKSEMQEELLRFLNLFGKDIARLYGVNDTWTEKEAIQESPIWKALSDMYDYGITGTPAGYLCPGNHIDGVYAHTEAFLRGIDTTEMSFYLGGNDTTPPRFAMLAMQTAVARIVLDDGWRCVDFGYGNLNNLEINEVALLANMDERSVRNAANPKLPDPLKTEQFGNRSLVSVKEARRWLAGRKGYIPTKEDGYHVAQDLPKFNIELTQKDMEIIERAAKQEGISVEAYFNKLLVRINEGLDK